MIFTDFTIMIILVLESGLNTFHPDVFLFQITLCTVMKLQTTYCKMKCLFRPSIKILTYILYDHKRVAVGVQGFGESAVWCNVTGMCYKIYVWIISITVVIIPVHTGILNTDFVIFYCTTYMWSHLLKSIIGLTNLQNLPFCRKIQLKLNDMAVYLPSK